MSRADSSPPLVRLKGMIGISFFFFFIIGIAKNLGRKFFYIGSLRCVFFRSMIYWKFFYTLNKIYVHIYIYVIVIAPRVLRLFFFLWFKRYATPLIFLRSLIARITIEWTGIIESRGSWITEGRREGEKVLIIGRLFLWKYDSMPGRRRRRRRK